MRTRLKLRFRLTISFFMFGLGLSILFSISAMYVRTKVENQLVISALQREAHSLVTQVKADPSKPPRFMMLKAWTWSQRTIYKAPLAWQNLENGVHDFAGANNGKIEHYKLAVERKGNIIGFVRYDSGRDELSSHQLLLYLIIVVFLFGLLSLILGRWLATRVLRPITDLAQCLRGYDHAAKSAPLSTQFADDEVGELALALDRYAERLTALVERDREFNSDVSHELRTPLAVISSTTELIQSAPNLDNKLHERLKRIERSSRQATEMIEALLLLSRAERRGPTFGEITDAGKIVVDVIESQRPHMRDKPVELRLRQVHTLRVNAPASVLAVVLTNLVGNAVKYTREGTVEVSILEDRIVIEDTGRGIKAEEAESLFQRGTRGKGVTSSGAGLGLAIARRLCELYGWHVAIRPREDVLGTVATVHFPASRPASA